MASAITPPTLFPLERRDSVDGNATGYGLDDGGVSTSSSPAIGSPSLLSNGYGGALSPGVKRAGREADHSPPTNAEVKKMWIYTSTHPYSFMA
jgi:hypothetical protein